MQRKNKSYQQPECPSSGEWLNKLWYGHTTETCPAMKRNLLISAATQMDLKDIMPSAPKGKSIKIKQ